MTVWEQERSLARNRRRRVAGAGTAVAIQGAFLLLHDADHAWRTRRGPVLVTDVPRAGRGPVPEGTPREAP